jgi:hypothetical protein
MKIQGFGDDQESAIASDYFDSCIRAACAVWLSNFGDVSAVPCRDHNFWLCVRGVVLNCR